MSEPLEGWDAIRQQVVRHLADGNHEDAATALREVDPTDAPPDWHGLAGLATFQLEDYEASARHYRAAIDKTHDTADVDDWKRMRDLAVANTTARVDVPVPDPNRFDRAELLAPRPVSLPAPTGVGSPAGPGRRGATLLGNLIGAVGAVIMHGLTQLWGNAAGYRDQVWTNWYRRRPQMLAVLTLAFMRNRLNSENLRSTYPAGARIGFQPAGQKPPPGVSHYRTADGSWNNLDDPMEGAAGTRFPRNVDNEAIRRALSQDLLEPNPRVISRELLTREGDIKEVPFLNLLAASWIQFENHDWITHGDNLSPGLIEVPIPEDDPARRRYHQTKMFVPRTQPDPTRQDSGDDTPVTFVNEVTHWWDGSQIYGSDLETQQRLRSFVDGKLTVTDDDTLPIGGDGVEDSGMVRNWWVGLAMLHNLFVLEHNAVCDLLKRHYPAWSDDQLFNVARLVNAAVMAKIHSVEWTPAILPNHVLDLGLNSNWYGMLTYYRKPQNRKTAATINVRNPELGGVVGNPINKHGSPYGLTEEFVEVYRLHSLLPEELRFRNLHSDEVIEETPFAASRQAASPGITDRVGMANLFYSFGNQHPGQLVLNNFPRFMQELSVPGNPLYDMGAVDIVRARERGIPRYNDFRRQLGLNPIAAFEDLTEDEAQVDKLKKVYGEDSAAVERLDLLVGTLAEGHRPTGFGFGETMFQIFILNATRRLQADRFYTDDYREEIYTPEGMRWVDDATLKKVIIRHFPELEATGLGNVKNAFEPWDPGPQLEPSRHPLRAFDPELKKDPWRGDAA